MIINGYIYYETNWAESLNTVIIFEHILWYVVKHTKAMCQMIQSDPQRKISIVFCVLVTFWALFAAGIVLCDWNHF